MEEDEATIVPLARSKEPVLFKGKKSYRFKTGEKKWLPGDTIIIQKGNSKKIQNEEQAQNFENIEGGAWFKVKTSDSSALSLRDSSNINTGKVIKSLPQGTWVYAQSQSIEKETVDGMESKWYKIAYPAQGYLFGGSLEKQEDLSPLKFAGKEEFSFTCDKSRGFNYKVYTAPSVKSEYLGEFEIKPEGEGYSSSLITEKKEKLDGTEGIWLHINEPVNGFIFGDRFNY